MAPLTTRKASQNHSKPLKITQRDLSRRNGGSKRTTTRVAFIASPKPFKMSSYPPSSSTAIHVQDIELTSPLNRHHQVAQTKRASSSKSRKLTIHPDQSSSQPLSLTSDPQPLTRKSSRSRQTSVPLSPELETSRGLNRAQFLNEERDPFYVGGEGEEVHMPDLGQMLGFNADSGDDHFAVAQGIKTRWKRKLYLLMEEPSSGREAFFVHILVTGAILFR